MTEKSKGYIVVFEGVGGPNSNHPGIRTWTSFNTKEDFDQALLEGRYADKVIAAGISGDDAVKLTRETREIDYVNAAFLTANQGGRLDEGILKLKLANIAWMKQFEEEDSRRANFSRRAGFLE